MGAVGAAGVGCEGAGLWEAGGSVVVASGFETASGFSGLTMGELGFGTDGSGIGSDEPMPSPTPPGDGMTSRGAGVDSEPAGKDRPCSEEKVGKWVTSDGASVRENCADGLGSDGGGEAAAPARRRVSARADGVSSGGTVIGRTRRCAERTFALPKSSRSTVFPARALFQRYPAAAVDATRVSRRTTGPEGGTLLSINNARDDTELPKKLRRLFDDDAVLAERLGAVERRVRPSQ
jgi:hypothetical protein